MSLKKTFQAHARWSQLTFALVVIGFVLQVIEMIRMPSPLEPSVFMVIASILTLYFCVRVQRAFMPLFLMSTFTLLVTWRLSVLMGYSECGYFFLAAFVLKILTYLHCAIQDVRAGGDAPNDPAHHATRFEWQLLFIRLYLGFDLVPHFTEKLLAGAAVRAGDISAFISLNVPHPVFMVWLAGLCELGGAIALGCGFITRLGSIGLFVYLMIATIMGHHLSNGFIWANAGGGWEYPVLWSVLVLTFACFGAGNFSIDRYLKDRFQLPMWLKHLMGGRHY